MKRSRGIEPEIRTRKEKEMARKLYFLSFLYGTIELLIEKNIITLEEIKKKVMEDLNLTEDEFDKIYLRAKS